MTVLTACRCLRGIPDAQTERVLVPLVERQVFVTEPAALNAFSSSAMAFRYRRFVEIVNNLSVF